MFIYITLHDILNTKARMTATQKNKNTLKRCRMTATQKTNLILPLDMEIFFHKP